MMRRRRTATLTTTAAGLLLVVILVAVGLAAVPALTYADPPDPTSWGGFWEDDDFDYIVLLVSNLQMPLPAAVTTFEPTMEVIGITRPLVLVPPVVERRLAFLRRGPPLA